MGKIQLQTPGGDSSEESGQPLDYEIPISAPSPRFPTYWTIAVSTGTFLLILLAWTIRTKFQKVFADFGVRLPLSTVVLIRFSRWVVDGMGWFVIAVVAVSLLAGGILIAWMRPKSFTSRRERWAARTVWVLILATAGFVVFALLMPMTALIQTTK
jgi:hypothetical protein